LNIRFIIRLSFLFLFFISFAHAFAHGVALPDFTVLAEKHGNTVVNISAIREVSLNQNRTPSVEEKQMQEFFKRFGIPGFPGLPFRGQPQEKRMSATGSGFIIETNGYIITNAHVVAQADTFIVKLADKREFKAKLLGIDSRTDIALLKIDASNLPKVVVGDPEKVKVGEWVAAIGSPFGLENTMTVGVVSAKGRALPQENFVPFIQTDVAINPGNSGGPLFNTRGEVIGINSQIYSRTGGYMGLSFAIPIDVAINVAEQLKLNGRVIRGWLGIAIQDITKELSESFGMKGVNGALIAGVNKNSPAERGGLQPGDVILKFNNKNIMTSSDLPKFVGVTKPNVIVPIKIARKGKKIELKVKIGEMPDDKKVAVVEKQKQFDVNRIGLVLKEISGKEKKALEGRNGLLVLEVKGKEISAKIRPGDIILALNNSLVSTVYSFNRELNKVPTGKTIALLLYRNGNTLFVPVKIK